MPSIADGAVHQLDPRFIPLQQAVGWIVTACLAMGTLVALFIFWLASGLFWLGFVLMPLWAIANAALAWHAQRWPAIEYRHASYRVDAQGIEIRRGVFWREVINVPRSRVQHTDVSQGPLERSYGLGTLVVFTAGSDYAKVDLGGLDHAIALRIREHLLPKGESDAV